MTIEYFYVKVEEKKLIVCKRGVRGGEEGVEKKSEAGTTRMVLKSDRSCRNWL